MANNRIEILEYPVDAAGDPDIIQIPDGSGPYQKITAFLASGLKEWTLYSPLITSPSKTFSIGYEKEFNLGPYQAGDVLGFVEVASGSDTLVLFCER